MTAPAYYTGTDGKAFGRSVEIEIPATKGNRLESTARAQAFIPIDKNGFVPAGYTHVDDRWFLAGAAAGIVDATAIALKSDPGDNYAVCLDAIQFANMHATVSTVVAVLDGVAVIWRGWAPAVDKGGGNIQSIKFDPPLRASASTALNFQCVTTGSATLVSAQGHLEHVTDEA